MGVWFVSELCFQLCMRWYVLLYVEYIFLNCLDGGDMSRFLGCVFLLCGDFDVYLVYILLV